MRKSSGIWIPKTKRFTRACCFRSAILALVVTSLCFLTNPKAANDLAQTMGTAEYQLPDGLEKEKNKGTDMSEIDTTGQYWLLYLVRENEETGYILTLNTKNYMKEDMLAWAQSFQF